MFGSRVRNLQGARMFVAGIDFDTHAVHLVLVDLDEQRPPWYHRFELHGGDAFDRARSVRPAMPGPTSILWDETLAFGIEEPQGRHKATVAKLKAVQGAVLACLPEGTLVHPLVPAEWRRLAGLPGNASKATVAALVLDDACANGWGEIASWPQDACDAYCIAHATALKIEQQEAA